MSTPLHGVQTGSYTSDGNARVISLRFDPDYFMLLNQTDFNEGAANPGVCKRAWWVRGLADAAGYRVQNTDAAATDESNFVTTNGFTLINTATDSVEAAQTGTAVTDANPAEVTLNSHGYANGDVIRLYNTTAMLQIAGLEFTIGSVATNTFELDYLDASGFADAATAVTARKVPFDPRNFAPKNRFITNISQAASAVVTLSVTHGYSVGEVVSFRCSSDFGMVEIDGLQGEITAVSTANNTITVDIDSNAFTAFAFPTSAIAAGGVTFPQTVPLGDAGQVLSGAMDNQAFIGLQLGTSVVGANNTVVRWMAMKGVV